MSWWRSLVDLRASALCPTAADHCGQAKIGKWPSPVPRRRRTAPLPDTFLSDYVFQSKAAARPRSAPYSHSIINEPSKLLICKALASAPQIFTVIFTVNDVDHQHWRGFPGGLAKTHLSRSIEVYRLPRPSPTPSTRIRVGPGMAPRGLASNCLSYCRDSLLRPKFYRQRPPGAVPSLSASDGLSVSNPLRTPDHRSWVRAMSSTGAGGRGNSPTTVAAMQARPRAAIPCEQCRPVWPRSSGRSRLAVPATTRHRPRSSAPTVRPCRQ